MWHHIDRWTAASNTFYNLNRYARLSDFAVLPFVSKWRALQLGHSPCRPDRHNVHCLSCRVSDVLQSTERVQHRFLVEHGQYVLFLKTTLPLGAHGNLSCIQFEGL